MVGFFFTHLLLGVSTLLASGRPRNGCADCVRLLEESLVSVPAYNVPAPSMRPDKLMAGASRVDITPPPGFPMGGNGFAAAFGRGYWTRLYARAFFFRDVAGQSLALVSCDLNAMAGGLQAQVAWLLRNDKLNLTRENLVLTATHVHQGPGNFMSSKVYNDRASPEPGFDSRLFFWLADRIGCAVREAARRARPSELVFKQGKVSELLRNRAPEPFLLNPDRDEVLAAGPPAIDCPKPFSKVCPRYRAVDETLGLLEIYQTLPAGTRNQVASLVFLSVHPEAMSHETALYQSDFTGLAMNLLERRYPPEEFVAAFFNGADGDISVRWKRQNRNEAVVFADSLVGAIDQTHAAGRAVDLDPNARIEVGQTDIKANPYFSTGFPGSWKAKANCVTNPNPGGEPLCLAPEPLFGVATVGGAEDSRTPMFDLGWKPGVRWNVARDGQGLKQGAFESSTLAGIDLTALVSPSCFYPESILVSLVGFGGSHPLTFAAIPGEATRTTWWRAKKALERVATLGEVVPLGLANEYIYYVTTREEYAAQGYEGSSDVFGPMTAEVIQAALQSLAKNRHAPIPEKQAAVEEAVFFPDWRPHHDLKLLFFGGRSGTQSFGPEWLGVARPDPDEGLENLIVDDRNLPFRHWPRFEWDERGIDDWNGSKRSTRVVNASGRSVDDDLGADLLTVYVSPPPRPKEATAVPSPSPRRALPGPRMVPTRKEPGEEAARRWMAVWLWPPGMDETETFYFSVRQADGTVVRSQSFRLKDVKNCQPPRSIPIDDGLSFQCR